MCCLTNMRLFGAMFVILVLQSSCSHFDTYSEAQKREANQVYNDLKSYQGLTRREHTYFIIFANTEYGGDRDDLDAWANTAEVLRHLALNAWKLPKQNLYSCSGSLANIDQTLQGIPDEPETQIIIYFSSHHEKDGEILIPMQQGEENSQQLGSYLERREHGQLLLLFDTCYALYAEQFFPQKPRFAYVYTSASDEKCYDFRPQGHWIEIDSFCYPSKCLLDESMGYRRDTYSPFGFAMLESHRRMAKSNKSATLSELIDEAVRINNEQLKRFMRMQSYPDLHWHKPVGWKEMRLKR